MLRQFLYEFPHFLKNALPEVMLVVAQMFVPFLNVRHVHKIQQNVWGFVWELAWLVDAYHTSSAFSGLDCLPHLSRLSIVPFSYLIYGFDVLVMLMV